MDTLGKIYIKYMYTLRGEIIEKIILCSNFIYGSGFI